MTNDEASTILVVEDDDVTRTFLADNLAADGYDPLVADCAGEGLRLAQHGYPDLALIDLNLPDAGGLELLRRVRQADRLDCHVDPELPVVVVSGRAGELDRVRGFAYGADDYVTKPFSYPELRARIEAVLRRSRRRATSGRLRVGELELDPASREVRLAGHRIELSQKEFALLRTLATEPRRVYTKEELLRTIWGYQSKGSTRTLDSHACRLRQKLGGRTERYIVNVWGVGYRLLDPPDED